MASNAISLSTHAQCVIEMDELRPNKGAHGTVYFTDVNWRAWRLLH